MKIKMNLDKTRIRRGVGQQVNYQQNSGQQMNYQQNNGQQMNYQQNSGQQMNYQQNSGQQANYQQNSTQQANYDQNNYWHNNWQADHGRNDHQQTAYEQAVNKNNNADKVNYSGDMSSPNKRWIIRNVDRRNDTWNSINSVFMHIMYKLCFRSCGCCLKRCCFISKQQRQGNGDSRGSM